MYSNKLLKNLFSVKCCVKAACFPFMLQVKYFFRSRGRLKITSSLQRQAEIKSLAFIYAVGENAVCHGVYLIGL